MSGFAHHSQDGCEVVEVAGELDIYSAADLRSLLLALAAAGNSRIVLDLTGCTFLDPIGLGVIAVALERATEQDGWLALAGASEGILRLLRTTGLDKVLSVSGSAEEAIAAQGAKL